MTDEIGFVTAVLDHGGPLAGVLIGAGIVLLALRLTVLPRLKSDMERIHDRLDKFEEKLDDARKAGADEHQAIRDRLSNVEGTLRVVQQQVTDK